MEVISGSSPAPLLQSTPRTATRKTSSGSTMYSEDNENSKSDGKGNQSSENSEDPESDSKKQTGRPPEQEMRRQEEGDSSSNPESQDSDDSLEPSDCETDHKECRLGGLHIKVERYGDGEVEELQDSPSSCSSSEEEDEVEDIVKDCNSGGELSGPAMSKHQKRKKRRKKQKWDGSRQRLCLSPSATTTPSPGSLDPTLGDQPPLLLPPSPTSSSVLKIKTEMSETINFDNDSSIWNYPPNREISRNESPYSMTKPHDTFPSPPPAGLQVSIPDSVLTPPGAEGGGGSRKPNFSGNSSSGYSAPTSVSSATPGSLVPHSSSTIADPLSPPLSASPRDKQQGTPTSSGSLLYTSDLEALQRLQAGNVVLPLVHRVTGTLAATSTASPRVYTTGTIRYAPADVSLAMQGNLLPNAHTAVNFVDGPGFGIDPKTPMEMLYHHVHRLNMSTPFGGAVSGAGLTQMPAANVFTTAEGLFSTLPFPVYSNGIHNTQTLERKED
uniref:Neuronal PAS domain protein 3 n=1 Tax=Sinocyclocheilus anshuiensis TaxID=1608454 RepID=A0A671MZA3_9TELE